MMQKLLPILILAVLCIAVIVAVIRLFKKGLKIGSFLSLVFSLTLLTFGAFLYLDINDFSNNFYNSSNMFVLVDNNTVLTGFYGMMEEEKEKPNFFTREMIEDMTTLYREDDYEKMKGNNYKMFIIDIRAFENIDNITIDDKKHSLGYIHSLILSEEPLEEYAGDLIENKDVPETAKEKIKQDLIEQTREEIGGDDAFRGALFASSLLGSAMEEQETIFLLKNFQLGMIEIHEESMLFKTIKYIPTPYLEAIIKED